MAATGKPLAGAGRGDDRLPQVLVNVREVDRAGARSPRLQAAVRAAEAELGAAGRVLLRPSGTEPVVRVMVEAADESQAHAVAARLVEVVQTELSL